jgi:hypothetical protein
MKHCAGFIGLYKNGFVIPMWADFDVEVSPVGSEEFRWHSSLPNVNAEPHPPSQYGGFVDPAKFQHLKIISPWVARTKTNTQFLFSDVSWENYARRSRVKVLPGIVNYKHQVATNINVVISKSGSSYIHNFDFREPMAHVTQLTEKKLVIHRHHVSTAEVAKLHTPRVSFVNSYGKSKKSCPFHR